MAIKIQEKKPEIPVEIGKLNFAFTVTDESVAAFRKNAIAAQKEFDKMKESENDEKSLERAKYVLQRSFDMILGQGAFKKIYDMTPSVAYLLDYFIQLVEGLSEELKDLGIDQEQTKKYIRKK
ncbi:hypothetical protein GCM10011391_28000 [Pullulanibacillus camelliae]|uniref:Uncharacterized protein n=1 Tax=Pullulanibacillus camelliae TaxID=1707096 RepID=A0A8J2YK85_9BACL|nr:hypothetical protein [Pullulanibacillus camelliae]GGE47618.1 hypothetical protein GCM10011391_28000 [Pullulanibacillus camelliae]